MPGGSNRAGVARRRPARTPLPVGWLAVGLLMALSLVVLVVLASGSDAYRILGYADPGALTKLGTYLLRFVVDLASAVCAGSLVYAAFFTASTPSAGLSAEGWAAVRLGGWSAWLWLAAALGIIPFDAADSIGEPVLEMLSPSRLAAAFTVLYEPKWWLVSALLALMVAAFSHVVLRWRAAVALAVVAVVGLLPPVVAGHAAAGAGHDLAMNSMAFHVVAAALWLGVLAALVVGLRRGTGRLDVAVRRYPRFAFGCWLVLALSGVVAAFLLVPPAQLLTTGYGRLLLAKVAGLLIVGLLGVLARRRALRSLSGTAASARGLMRLIGAEVAVLLVTVAVATGMTQLPPPGWFVRELSPAEVAFGYALPGPPTPANLLTTWRMDLLLGTAFLAAAALYLAGVRRLRRRGERWPAGRAVAWVAGCALVLLATSSGVGAYAPAAMSAHMATHMTLNMLAPLVLVLGAPVTLALRALAPAAPGAAAGPREWLVALTNSPAARLLSRPGLAAALLVTSYYLLYFTGLFEAATSEHWSRMALNVVTLAIGYQFYWIVIGVDPAPRRLPHLGRLGVVFAVMPFHAVFAVVVISMPTVIAENYYRTLGLPWATDLLADQRVAGVISLAMGELALVIAQVVLLVQWYRYDQFAGFRGGPMDDEEAAAYDAMLARLKQTRAR